MPYRKCSKKNYKPRKTPPPYPYSRPRRIKPMLAARGTEEDIEDPGRDEERKYDGTRAFIIKDGDNVVMRGRSWIDRS